MSFFFYQQPDQMDCGPTCLRMVARHFGRSVSLEKLRKLSETTRSGSSLQGISTAAEHIGFKSLGVKISFQSLQDDAPLPSIVFWNNRHFVVVYKIKKNKVYIADPAHGLLTYKKQEFIDNWIGKHANHNTEEGLVLLLEPTPKINEIESDDQAIKQGFGFIFQHLRGYRRLMIQLGLGLFVVSLLQLVFPFLTQSVVDIGIENRDTNFLYLVLIGQLFVFFGRTAVEIIRGWILLHLSTRINISLVSDFLIKLMKLPMSFFDVKITGDIMQRIGDHQRIENLLTNQSLNVLFSIINFIVFGIVLAIYNIPVFLIFLLGTIIYFFWISFFMKKRKDLDHKRFSQISDERMKIMELISGMQEIKLHNAELQKRWGWEMVQVRLIKLQISSLRLEQFQSQGAAIINELKNILISFFTAKLVIDGQLTLGMMLSVSYIIGQLNGPVSQFLGFIFSLQDARISLERLAEIHNKEDEEPIGVSRINQLPENSGIELKDVTFRYVGSEKEVLKNINLNIPENKITAIVGSSGSGKTTLMKLLLRFYNPTQGKILLGNRELNNFTQFVWRQNCGSVMQDGFLFSDTIANNIAVGEDRIDKEKLRKAVYISNIQEFIESLPLSYNTKIGAEGLGISGGQKQRILIGRAVYKNPKFLFFDEATSALDAQNESIIMQNLNEFFKGRTVVVVAHRLSTVKNADQIIVMENGLIIEQGTHIELLSLRGSYFNLVKNQLDLEKIEAVVEGIPEIHRPNT
jgi:ATP-binding cassette subfamily B protein